MKKLAVVLVAMSLTGVPAYLWVASSAFDISPEHPLGRFERIDAWLREQGFDRREQQVDAVCRKTFGPELSGETVLVYRHGRVKDADRRGSRIAVALDGSGRVVAIAGRFRSGAEDLGPPGSRGESFVASLWVNVAGQRPVFADDERGAGRFAERVRVGTFDRNGVTGHWLKSYGSPEEAHTIGDRVSLSVN
jgi:hypothetical protein